MHAANIKLTLVLSCNLLVMEQHFGILDMSANYLKNTKTLNGEKPNKFIYFLFTKEVRVTSHKSELCSHYKTWFE